MERANRRDTHGEQYRNTQRIRSRGKWREAERVKKDRGKT